MGVISMSNDDILKALFGEVEPSGETTTFTYIKGPTIHMTVSYKEKNSLWVKIKRRIISVFDWLIKIFHKI